MPLFSASNSREYKQVVIHVTTRVVVRSAISRYSYYFAFKRFVCRGAHAFATRPLALVPLDLRRTRSVVGHGDHTVSAMMYTYIQPVSAVSIIICSGSLRGKFTTSAAGLYRPSTTPRRAYPKLSERGVRSRTRRVKICSFNLTIIRVFMSSMCSAAT